MHRSIGVQTFAEHHEAVIEVFGGNIEEHIDARDQIFVPQQRLCQIIAQQGGHRGEHAVEKQHQGHGPGDIGGAPECKSAVEREIPHHRDREGDEVARPIAPPDQLIKQGEDTHLDDARRGGEQNKLHNAPEFTVFLLRHGADPPDRTDFAAQRHCVEV